MFSRRLVVTLCRLSRVQRAAGTGERNLFGRRRMSAAAGSARQADLLEFLKFVGQLKHLRREGWLRKGLDGGRVESVAGHMYRMAVMAFLLEPPLDRDKCIRMALVHDMAECIVGDITPHCNVSLEDKRRLERKAFQRLSELAPSPVGAEMLALYLDYEGQQSDEARAVKELDKFDMVLQAFEYEQQLPGGSTAAEMEGTGAGTLQEFFDSASGAFRNDWIKAWLNELHKQRTEHFNCSSGGKPGGEQQQAS